MSNAKFNTVRSPSRRAAQKRPVGRTLSMVNMGPGGENVAPNAMPSDLQRSIAAQKMKGLPSPPPAEKQQPPTTPTLKRQGKATPGLHVKGGISKAADSPRRFIRSLSRTFSKTFGRGSLNHLKNEIEMMSKIDCELLQLLKSKNGPKIVAELGAFISDTDVGSTSNSIMRLFRHEFTDYIIPILNSEIARTETDTATLFRGSSLGMKLSRAHMELEGKTYLKETLGKLVMRITGSASMEIDPHKIGPNGNINIEGNKKKMMGVVSNLLIAIYASGDKVPLTFKRMFQAVRSNMTGRFADMEYRAIAQFFFLRFVNPYISMQGTSPDGRRNAILTAKLMQNISTNTMCTGKEEYMKDFNEFIAMQEEPMRNFLDQISTVGANAPMTDDLETTSPPCVEMKMGDALHTLYCKLKTHRPDMEASWLEKQQQYDLLNALQPALAKYAEQFPNGAGSNDEVAPQAPRTPSKIGRGSLRGSTRSSHKKQRVSIIQDGFYEGSMGPSSPAPASPAARKNACVTPSKMRGTTLAQAPPGTPTPALRKKQREAVKKTRKAEKQKKKDDKSRKRKAPSAASPCVGSVDPDALSPDSKRKILRAHRNLPVSPKC